MPTSPCPSTTNFNAFHCCPCVLNSWRNVLNSSSDFNACGTLLQGVAVNILVYIEREVDEMQRKERKKERKKGDTHSKFFADFIEETISRERLRDHNRSVLLKTFLEVLFMNVCELSVRTW